MFRLLGHDCPLGEYPSPVVPVGEVDGKLFAAFRGEGGVTLSELDTQAMFIRHDEELREKLSSFYVNEYALFANSEREVVSYRIEDETMFFSGLLKDPEREDISNEFRFSLAVETKSEEIALVALNRSASDMSKYCPPFLESWYRQTTEGAYERGFFGDAFPESVERLLELDPSDGIHSVTEAFELTEKSAARIIEVIRHLTGIATEVGMERYVEAMHGAGSQVADARFTVVVVGSNARQVFESLVSDRSTVEQCSMANLSSLSLTELTRVRYGSHEPSPFAGVTNERVSALLTRGANTENPGLLTGGDISVTLTELVLPYSLCEHRIDIFVSRRLELATEVASNLLMSADVLVLATDTVLTVFEAEFVRKLAGQSVIIVSVADPDQVGEYSRDRSGFDSRSFVAGTFELTLTGSLWRRVASGALALEQEIVRLIQGRHFRPFLRSRVARVLGHLGHMKQHTISLMKSGQDEAKQLEKRTQDLRGVSQEGLSEFERVRRISAARVRSARSRCLAELEECLYDCRRYIRQDLGGVGIYLPLAALFGAKGLYEKRIQNANVRMRARIDRWIKSRERFLNDLEENIQAEVSSLNLRGRLSQIIRDAMGPIDTIQTEVGDSTTIFGTFAFSGIKRVESRFPTSVWMNLGEAVFLPQMLVERALKEVQEWYDFQSRNLVAQLESIDSEISGSLRMQLEVFLRAVDEAAESMAPLMRTVLQTLEANERRLLGMEKCEDELRTTLSMLED